MRSMTDFIDSINVDNIPSVYNEYYSWAEEYAEYYNEESDNYAQPILESSGYQFFGEACFIQEASKGLIAGGILALVSGALFMIMKLLKNGGSSSGSTSSSKYSSGSSKKSTSQSTSQSMSDIINSGPDPTDEEINKKMEELFQKSGDLDDEWVQWTSKPQNQESKETPEAPYVKPDDQEAKAKAEKEKSAKQAAEEEKNRKALLEESKRKAEEAKKAKEDSYVKPDELEAEENLVFNAKIIIDELNKFKKQGYDDVSVNNGHALYDILNGLEKIDDITDFLVKLVKEGRWEIFGSSTTEKGFAETFHKKCAELHEIVKTIQLESSKINNENESSHDISIDSVISDIKNIDKVSKDIESKCKEGMKLCKAERTRLINAKKDVSNVDKAYKILNDIIRDVNVVCKNIQTAFRTVHKSFMGKKHLYPLNPNWISLSYIGTSWDPFEDSKDYMMFIKQRNHDVEPKYIVERALKALQLCCEQIFYANDNTKISDKTLDAAKDWKTHQQETIQKSLRNISNIFNACKKEKPEYSGIYDKVEQVTQKGYELLSDMYKVNPASKALVGKKKSECKEPAFVNLLTYARDYLFDDKPKYVELVDKISQTVEVLMDSLPPNTPVGKLYDDIGKNMNKLEGVLEDRYLSRFKSSYEKGLKMFNDPDEDDEDVFSEIYQSLRKNVWERQNTLSNDNLKHLIAFLGSIGFKEANFSEGQKITPRDGKYFKEIFKQPTDDASLNFTIKKIYEYPMEMNITLDDDDFHAILPGKISMYTIKG